MPKFFTIPALFLVLLFLAGSCATKKITASGSKSTVYTKFNHRFSNKQINRAAVYQRYVAHNRNFNEFPKNKRNRSKTEEPATKKGLLAQNR